MGLRVEKGANGDTDLLSYQNFSSLTHTHTPLLWMVCLKEIKKQSLEARSDNKDAWALWKSAQAL